MPWNPTGAILGPLGVLSLVALRRRGKGKKNEPYLFLFIMLVVLPVSVGMACGTQPTQPSNQPVQTQTPVQLTETSGPTTVINATPIATQSPTDPLTDPCENCPPTETPTPIGTPTPTPLDEKLAQYGVYFTGVTSEWTSARIEAVRSAVRTVGERFAGIIGGSGMDAFKRVYGYINFEWTYDAIDGFGLAYDDHTIKWDGFYTTEHQGVRNVVHELGHMFDRKVCASRQSDGVCDLVGDEVFHNSARTDLRNVWNDVTCGRGRDGQLYLCLSRSSHRGPEPGMFWGFAGDWQEWQFGATHGEGEVWADMFLGWVYDTWGNDIFGDRKREYMNREMDSYLRTFR